MIIKIIQLTHFYVNPKRVFLGLEDVLTLIHLSETQAKFHILDSIMLH